MNYGFTRILEVFIRPSTRPARVLNDVRKFIADKLVMIRNASKRMTPYK